MNRDDHSPADSASTLAQPPGARAEADDEPTIQRPRAESDAPRPVAPRRSLAENWAAFANPLDDDDASETPSISLAVSDALEGALAEATPAPDPGESVDDGFLPPPPDRSGTSFGTWDPEGDDRDRPEFFRDITDETSASGPDWRARLADARAADSVSRPVPTLDPLQAAIDESSAGESLTTSDDATGIPTDDDAPGIPADDDDEEDDEEAAVGAGALTTAPAADDAPGIPDDDDDLVSAAPVIPEDATGIPSDDDVLPAAEADVVEPASRAAEADAEATREIAPSGVTDDDDDATALRRPVVPPAERVQPTTVAGLPHVAWTPIAVDDIDDDEEDEEAALLALARKTDNGERRVMIDRGDDDDDEETDALRPRSRAISGEIIDDHPLGAEGDAPPPADELAPPRPREDWITDESDPSADFFRDLLSIERWQEPGVLEGRVLLGRYRLGERLGDGEGFRVHAAVTTVGERPIVVKVVGPDHPALGERARLFRREARTMARLEHPRVAEVVDVGVTRDGLSFMVTARIDGPSLAARLARDGRLPWPTAVPIVRQILEVTDAVQHRGLVHRTVHPGNVYLAGDKDGVPQVVLTNVGVTPLCTTHRRPDGTLAITTEGLLGAAEYMAPEVVSGNLPDHATDIYAVGVLFYELLLGEPPFAAEGLIALLKQHLYEPPPPPREHAHGGEVPEAFEAVILRALAKDPGERYPSVQAVLDDLAAAEARQHELERAKTLLSDLDAALWGDESGVAGAVREEPAESGPRERPPIAPLTDDDKPPEERSGLPRTTAQLPAIPDREPPKAAPEPAIPPPAPAQAVPSPTRNLAYLVGAVLLLIALLVVVRPGGDEPTPTPTPTPKKGGPETIAEVESPIPDPSATASGGALAVPTPPDPSDVAPLDPSEGALDPSEGALDPSEGALDPSEGALDPSEGAPDPSGGDAPPDPPEAPPEAPETPETAPPPRKPPPGPADALSASAIRSKLNGVRSRVSKECGMSGGLFAPVGLTVKVSVNVDPSGKVGATPSGGATKMGQCAAKIVETLRFPATRRGGSLVHTFKL